MIDGMVRKSIWPCLSVLPWCVVVWVGLLMAHNPLSHAETRLESVRFADLNGWDEDNHLEAFQAFLLSCEKAAIKSPRSRPLGPSGDDLQRVCISALALGPELDRAGAKRFFEEEFTPHRIMAEGFVTGYFEPSVPGSRQRSEAFPVPLLKKPDDLIKRRLPVDDDRAGGLRFGRETAEGFLPHFDRKAIDNGALDGLGLELVWLESRIEAFFIHLQGSARIELEDGSIMRVGFAGKSGHDYTPIGRVLIDHGLLRREDVTMQSIRDWLRDHPDEANEVMWQNRSFIFFQETDADPEFGPVAAAGVPLVPWRSLAVDRTLHTFGTPVWVETSLEHLSNLSESPTRLMIAQDTGSAIVGPARGDIFTGSGFEMGQIAGAIKHSARMTLLMPRSGRAQP